MVWRAAGKVRAKGITITRYVLWGSRPEFRSARAVQELLEVIHSDVAGPMEIPSLSGSHYYVTFIDNRSRRMFMYFLKTTSGEEILGRLKQFQAQAECQCERKIKIVRTDNSKEYIRLRRTIYYTPEHNGLAECANWTTTKCARLFCSKQTL